MQRRCHHDVNGARTWCLATELHHAVAVRRHLQQGLNRGTGQGASRYVAVFLPCVPRRQSNVVGQVQRDVLGRVRQHPTRVDVVARSFDPHSQISTCRRASETPRGEDRYRDRLADAPLQCRPGLTCLSQVNGRSETAFNQWVRLDLDYIDNWSLALVMRILIEGAAISASHRSRGQRIAGEAM